MSRCMWCLFSSVTLFILCVRGLYRQICFDISDLMCSCRLWALWGMTVAMSSTKVKGFATYCLVRSGMKKPRSTTVPCTSKVWRWVHAWEILFFICIPFAKLYYLRCDNEVCSPPQGLCLTSQFLFFRSTVRGQNFVSGHAWEICTSTYKTTETVHLHLLYVQGLVIAEIKL